jgi:predicted nucleic acid-binding protein
MIYLLDVNALVALGFMNHEFHARVALWVRATRSIELASSSITELGFVRVLSQAPAYGFTVVQARSLLLRLKQARSFPLLFLPDQVDISHLPGWVKTPKQITDGHLGQLAKTQGAILATLDENIPGSHLIPK